MFRQMSLPGHYLMKEVKKVRACSWSAWQWLLAKGFLQKPRKCLVCGHAGLEEAALDPRPRKRKLQSFLAVRCGQRACRAYNNVVHYSVFRGARLNTQELVEVVGAYATWAGQEAPAARKLARATGFGKWTTGSVVSTLLALESKAGKVSSNTVKLSGDLEGDATCLS